MLKWFMPMRFPSILTNIHNPASINIIMLLNNQPCSTLSPNLRPQCLITIIITKIISTNKITTISTIKIKTKTTNTIKVNNKIILQDHQLMKEERENF